MKLTKREFATNCGLKLNKLKHLRLTKENQKCAWCQLPITSKFAFVEIAYRDLKEPIVGAGFIITRVPSATIPYCVRCGVLNFPELFKKKIRQEIFDEADKER